MSVRPVPAASIYVSMMLDVSVEAVREGNTWCSLRPVSNSYKSKFASPRLSERYYLCWF